MIPFQDQAGIYGLLGRIFISELDQSSLVTLKDPDIASVFEKIHPGFEDYVGETQWDDESIEQLAGDYCRLFVLPKNPSLSLSVSRWLGKASLDMARLEALIEALDLDLSAMTGTVLAVPHDHLGLLLYLLSAIYGSDDAGVQGLGAPLVKMALSPWVSSFAEKLAASGANPIYSASGKLLFALSTYDMGLSPNFPILHSLQSSRASP